MRPFRFHDPDVPDDLRHTKVWRLAKRLGHARCFYTGLECFFYRPDRASRGRMDLFPHAATREHLIPKRRCGLNDREAELNIVIASSWMNNLVANAPLPIKLEVRDNIRTCLEDQEITDDVLDCLAGRTYQVLNDYRIGRKYPWQLSSFTDPAEKQVALMFMRLMHEWEHRLFRNHFLPEGSPHWLPTGTSLRVDHRMELDVPLEGGLLALHELDPAAVPAGQDMNRRLERLVGQTAVLDRHLGVGSLAAQQGVLEDLGGVAGIAEGVDPVIGQEQIVVGFEETAHAVE